MKRIFFDGLWHNNPGVVQLLGLCPLLAITTTVSNALGLALATLFVLVISNTIVSLARRALQKEIRIPAYVLIIASLVTTVELFFHAFFPELHARLGIFLPLIVTNCAIVARAESFASRQPPLSAMIDGLGHGIGFAWVLLLIGALREFVGGALLIAILPPGAFFALALVLMLYKLIERQREPR